MGVSIGGLTDSLKEDYPVVITTEFAVKVINKGSFNSILKGNPDKAETTFQNRMPFFDNLSDTPFIVFFVDNPVTNP